MSEPPGGGNSFLYCLLYALFNRFYLKNEKRNASEDDLNIFFNALVPVKGG